ncbi:TerD family protein [Flammeovirga kamogawensis]|uniref:TerD family protein n=1 Tax=Flammeovirga kamogawensis TaxID=373891 RepID=A0ABX8H0D8_9BACT|nr:TerD family protein [Flammeovirga kamogawensis]MBB6459517.1 tellurium resistance protein TerZ [Flammeovirga kamogawensis]QWG09068.1 TerD family protein [Flammeovirga kamogawensis]TRX67356.1 TerD family protein [Flammeovirga kamogawensis]
MNTSLTKKSGISLSKGSKISLMKKDGNKLDFLRVGVNWGAIQGKALFGLINHKVNVDLDASISAFDKEMNEIYTVYYNELTSPDGAVTHTGDDLEGDDGEDDGLDNETIQIHLDEVQPDIDQIFLYLNSYKKQDFATIPFSEVRMYTKNEILATFNLSSDQEFAGYVSMIMGRLYKLDGNWKFEALGEPIRSRDIEGTIKYLQIKYS